MEILASIFIALIMTMGIMLPLAISIYAIIAIREQLKIRRELREWHKQHGYTDKEIDEIERVRWV